MKNIAIVERSRPKIHEARIKPEDKVKNVLNRLELGRGFLVRSFNPEADPLKGNDLIHEKVDNYEKLHFYSARSKVNQIPKQKRGGDRK